MRNSSSVCRTAREKSNMTWAKGQKRLNDNSDLAKIDVDPHSLDE